MTGGWAWLAVIVAIAIYEIWATKTPGAQTLSEWVWVFGHTHRWFRWVVIAFIVVLLLHFFGPVGWFGRAY